MAYPRADTASKIILSGSDLHRVVDRIAHQILEKTSGATGTVLLGIPTRGVPPWELLRFRRRSKGRRSQRPARRFATNGGARRRTVRDVLRLRSGRRVTP